MVLWLIVLVVVARTREYPHPAAVLSLVVRGAFYDQKHMRIIKLDQVKQNVYSWVWEIEDPTVPVGILVAAEL